MKQKKTKKHSIKDIIIGMTIATIIFTFVLPVVAAPLSKTVEIVYNSIKINVDGNEITPKDANGNVVEPFNYNGTVYLPVRAIGEALGKDVSWDGNSQTVFLKDKAQTTAQATTSAPPAPTQPAPATETTTFSGQLAKQDSVDTYNFALPYSARVTLSFEHDYVDNSGNYWKVQFISKNGVVAEFWVQGNISKMDLNYAMYLPADNYTVRIQPGYYSNSDYKVNVTYEKNIGQFEYEPNDSISTATPIQFNNAIKGNLLSNNDIDYYKFTVTSKKEISLKFNHDFVDNSGNYWKIELISPNNGTLSSFWVAGNVMETISDKITLTDAGDYYIKITPGYGSQVDYSIAVLG